MSKDFIELGKFLGRAKNRLYRVGVELEGGWSKLPEGVNRLSTDSSVKIPVPESLEYSVLQEKLTALRRAYDHATSTSEQLKLQDQGIKLQAQFDRVAKTHIQTGELVSPILEVDKWQQWMKHHFPSHVNDTCGLHVHMSFVSARHYGMLMIPEFQATVRRYVKEWAEAEKLPGAHPLWHRLSGKNEFCKFEFFPDLQAVKQSKEYNHHGEGNRYTAIAYRWGEHGTIECRLLPMMDTVEQSIRAVQNVLDITNACLVVLRQKEDKLKVDLVVAKDMVASKEERRLYV